MEVVLLSSWWDRGRGRTGGRGTGADSREPEYIEAGVEQGVEEQEQIAGNLSI